MMERVKERVKFFAHPGKPNEELPLAPNGFGILIPGSFGTKELHLQLDLFTLEQLETFTFELMGALGKVLLNVDKLREENLTRGQE